MHYEWVFVASEGYWDWESHLHNCPGRFALRRSTAVPGMICGRKTSSSCAELTLALALHCLGPARTEARYQGLNRHANVLSCALLLNSKNQRMLSVYTPASKKGTTKCMFGRESIRAPMRHVICSSRQRYGPLTCRAWLAGTTRLRGRSGLAAA